MINCEPGEQPKNPESSVDKLVITQYAVVVNGKVKDLRTDAEDCQFLVDTINQIHEDNRAVMRKANVTIEWA